VSEFIQPEKAVNEEDRSSTCHRIPRCHGHPAMRMALMRLSPDLEGSLDGSVFKNCLIRDCTGQSECEGDRLSIGQTRLVDSRTPLLTACRPSHVMGSAPDLMTDATIRGVNRKSASTRHSADYDDPYTYILSEGRHLSNDVSVSSSSYLVTAQDAKAASNISSRSSSSINLCQPIDACASATPSAGSL